MERALLAFFTFFDANTGICKNVNIGLALDVTVLVCLHHGCVLIICKFLSFCLVSEENLQKNISQFSKSVKQMEIDMKNAQHDKSALPHDRFLPIMTISFYVFLT